MSPTVSLEQSHELVAKLQTNIDWKRVPSEVAQGLVRTPVELGERTTEFLINGAKPTIILDGKKIVDCRRPSRPEGWTEANGWKVPFHRPMGSTIWRPEDATLWLSEKQKTGLVTGHKLFEQIKRENIPVLPDAILDYFVANPEEIPEEWAADIKASRRWPYFWGTVYCDPHGGLMVRCLYWGGKRFCADYDSLDDGFHAGNPAASLAS